MFLFFYYANKDSNSFSEMFKGNDINYICSLALISLTLSIFEKSLMTLFF